MPQHPAAAAAASGCSCVGWLLAVLWLLWLLLLLLLQWRMLVLHMLLFLLPCRVFMPCRPALALQLLQQELSGIQIKESIPCGIDKGAGAGEGGGWIAAAADARTISGRRRTA